MFVVSAQDATQQRIPLTEREHLSAINIHISQSSCLTLSFDRQQKSAASVFAEQDERLKPALSKHDDFLLNRASDFTSVRAFKHRNFFLLPSCLTLKLLYIYSVSVFNTHRNLLYVCRHLKLKQVTLNSPADVPGCSGAFSSALCGTRQRHVKVYLLSAVVCCVLL